MEAKVAIMAVAFIAFFVSPVFWGSILLMAFSAYMAPWPAVIAILTIILVGASWMVLFGRLKSDGLITFDVIYCILLLICLVGTSHDFSVEINYIWMAIIYMTSALQLFLHMFLALFVALGFVVTFKDATQPATA